MAGQQHEVAESKVSKKARYIWRGCIYILRPILKSNLRPQAYHCSIQLQPSTEQESLSTVISKQGKLIIVNPSISPIRPTLSLLTFPLFFSLSLSPLFPFPFLPLPPSFFFYLIFTSQTSPPHYSAPHNARQTKSDKQLREQTVLGGDVLVVRRLM